MKFMSFLRFFGKRWLRDRAPRKRRAPVPHARLRLEALEKRELLTGDVPRIVNVTPADNSFVATLNPPPTLQITFSEPMVGSNASQTGASDPNNYLLINSTGDVIPVEAATLNATGKIVTLTYNNSNPLPANTYSLFIRGQNVVDVDDGFALAQQGQLFVSNNGQNNVSAVVLGNDGTLGAAGNYPLPANGTTKAAPYAVAHADLNGDGIPDLIIATSGTNGAGTAGTDQVLIFAGHSTAQGAGFSLKPDLTLNLPASVPALVAAGFVEKSIAVTDFNNDGLPDFAVANADSKKISVFINNRQTVGVMDFTLDGNYTLNQLAATETPGGLVTGDFNNDGFQDIAAVDFNPSTAPNTNYHISLLINNGSLTGPYFSTAIGRDFSPVVGNFGDPTASPVVPSAGVLNPDAIAVADFNGDKVPDLAVGGSNGIVVLYNDHNGNAVTFDGGVNPFIPVIITPGQVVAMAAGTIDAGATPDIAAALVGSTPGVDVLTNSGGGFASYPGNWTQHLFGEPGIVTGSVGSVQLILQDINGDGKPDILVSSDHFNLTTTPPPLDTGEVFIFLNTSAGKGVSFAHATQYPLTTDGQPIGLDLLDTNQDGKLDLVTANFFANDFTLFLGNGDGTFRVPTDTPVTPTPAGEIAIGDFNGDGIPDVAIVNDNFNSNSSFVTVLLGLGNNTYSAPVNFPVVAAGSGNTFNDIVSVAVADLNNDKKPDIILASRNSSQVEVLTNNIANGATSLTAGSFTLGQVVTVGDQPTQLITGDFNGDGNIDVAVSHDRPNGPASRRGVTILLGNGDGTFQTPYEVLAAQGTNASSLVAADFNNDGKPDLAVADNTAPGDVRLLINDGTGNFNLAGTFPTGLINPDHIAAADFNNDGYQDIIVSSSSNSNTTGGIAVLLNQFGTGFTRPVRTNALPGTPLRDFAVVDLNQDGHPDIIVSTDTATGPTGQFSSFTLDNVFALVGNGDGTFQAAVPYLAGDFGDKPIAAPSFLATTGSPLLRLTTFTTGGDLIKGNLLANGGFEATDLSDEKGNLLGWSTYRLSDSNTGSHGMWSPQTGEQSPLSAVPVPAPSQGVFSAMLDQADQIPLTPPSPGNPPPPNPNPPADYAGTNVLFQDFLVPASSTVMEISMTLFIESESKLSDASLNPSLDYHTSAANQQVRVDLMDPSGPVLGYETGSDPFVGGVLKNLFQTLSTDPKTQLVTLHLSTDPSSPFYNASFAQLLPSLAGRTIRLRVAAADNQGKLIVGVDNVRVIDTYTDTTAPAFVPPTPPHIRNTSFVQSGVPYTTDPTIVGRVNDDGSLNNTLYVALDPYNTNFTGPNVYKINTWDALGNFSFTLPNLQPGVYKVGVRIVDRAGNMTNFTVTFGLQGPSVTQWEATGPDGIDVTGQNVDYTSVSGRVTAMAVDPADISGNTYYVASANGGVWKTTDGGSSWTPLTDSVVNASGGLVAEPIGAIAIARTETTPGNKTIYAGTGVADLETDSRPGTGILKSIDGGQTWTLLVGTDTSDKAADFVGARISKIVIDNSNPNIVYVAVAAGGPKGPGVYKSTDGGQTWTDVLTPSTMFANGTALVPGTALASVTDLVEDPFDSNHLLVGLGNMGLLAPSATAGVWVTENVGGRWDLVTGGDHAFTTASTLPFGLGVGRVTLALSTVRVANETTEYVLISNPPGNNSAPNVDEGTFAGLFKSSNNGLDFTKVMLKQNLNPIGQAPNFVDIGLGVEGSNSYALAVDPRDPNVVYVGGSRRFSQSNSDHALIRVDTGDMIDISTTSNSGDDAAKVAAAAAAGGKYPGGTAYAGEGVYWYDIETAQSGGLGALHLLPPDLHALAFDEQGRLVIGTDGGVWRGEDRGFGYDFSSGGSGILPGNSAFTTAGMNLTAINGNLQITGLTSVAIDPTTPGQVYTTQFGTGSADSNKTLSWTSQGPTGPTVVVNGQTFNLGIPNGDLVRAASPDPTAAPGTPTTLYRLWQFANQPNPNLPPTVVGVLPERSTDGGQTWTAFVNSGIPTSNNPAGMFPAFAVSPTKLPNSGQYFDELLLGTQKVFRSRTSGNAWDVISGQLTTGQITSFGISPSQADFFYAGTNLGEVFVTTNAGGDGWILRNGGLPTASVTDIAVDPKNPLIAYVTFGTGALASFSHVWKTTDGGKTWKNISSNLPMVNANAFVIDRRPALDAPGGKLYVATDVGIYTSLNEGQSWVRVGSSLPNAPVVDLQQATTSGQDTLAAAVQGRGVFTLSTAQISPIDDQLLAPNSNTGALAFTINTVGVPAGSPVSVAAYSDTPSVIPQSDVLLAGAGTNWAISIQSTAATTTAGNPVTITIVLTDSLGQEFFEQFHVTVVGNLVVNENSSASFVVGANESSTLTATTTDPNLLPVTGITFTDLGNNLRRVTITPGANHAGTGFVTLVSTDVAGLRQTVTFAVDVRTPVITLPFSDNFNRPDNPFLGTAWTSESGSASVKSNAGLVTAADGFGASVNTLNGLSAQDVQLDLDVTLNNPGDLVGLIARHSGSGETNMYIGALQRIADSGGVPQYEAYIYRNVGGALTLLANANVTALVTGPTTHLHFEVVGPSLQLFVTSGGSLTEVASAIDGALTSGDVGVWGNKLTASFDNFAAAAAQTYFSPTPLPAGTTDPTAPPYTVTITAAAGMGPDTSFTVLGNLPPGLTPASAANSLTISGIPTAPGVYPFTVQATDNTSKMVIQAYVLVITPPNISYDSTGQVLTVTPTTGGSAFDFTQAGLGMDTVTFDGTPFSMPESMLTQVVVNDTGDGNSATLHTAGESAGEVITTGNNAATLFAGGRAFVAISDVQYVSGFATTADSAYIVSTPGITNKFVTVGNYATMSSDGVNALYYVTGALSVTGYAASTMDQAYQYDGSGPSYFTVSGTAYSIMTGMDAGRNGVWFQNSAIGFAFNEGIARHRSQDIAIIYDSPGNDRFIGTTGEATLFTADNTFAEDDIAYNFGLVYAYSFNGGFDTATNYDASVNIVSYFNASTGFGFHKG